MKAPGYWFYFSGTEGHRGITGSNSWSAFPVGSMSLTHMPKLKFFFKCCVILTSTKISASQNLDHLSHWKKTSAIAHEQQGGFVSAAEPKRFSHLCCGASQRPGSEHYEATLTQQKNTPSARAVLLCPPAPSLASPRTGGGRCETARRQRHHQPLSARRRGWRGSVPRLLLTNPTLGVQMELSQARQTYSLIWEGRGLEKTGLPPTPHCLTYLRVKCYWSQLQR